jgi:hypothetical protein
MIKEIDILNQVNEYLKKNGYSYKNEVKFLERRIDVIGVKKKEVLAIEIKIKNWKKALQQAITCKLCSHYVYVAFYHKYLPKNLSYFENYGIGVMSVNDSVEIINKSKKSEIIHKSLLNDILKQIGDQDD